MKSVKLTFGSLVLVAMLVVSLLSSGFSQTVLAGNITIKATSNMYHAEVYSVITRLKSDGGLEVLSQGPVTNGAELSATIDSSEKVCFIFFGKPEKGYLITGAGTGGKGNMSHISELRDPEKLGRTEAKVPEEILQKMEQEGYLIAWGYTRGNGQGNGKINDSVDGFKPSVISSIRNTSGEIEPGKPITMEIVIRPDKAFREASDKRKYWTAIPEGEATVTIDGKKVLPVTGITKENENLYKGTISFVLGDEDASVNTHTAVVNANVHYTAELALSKAGSAYSGEPVKTTTVVEAPPATVSFSLISGPSRKLMYDLNYEGAETIAPEYHDSGTSVTVRPDIYVRPGYEFGGWDTLDSQGNAVNRKPSDTFIMPDRVTGTKLTARWRPYLTVDCANGSAVYSVPYEVGSLATPIRPLKKDYYFSGWKVDNGKQYGVSEDIIMPDKPLKITATWYNTISSIIKPVVNTPVIPDEKAEDKPAKKTVADNNTEKKPSQGKKSEAEDKKTSESKSDKKSSESKSGNKKSSSSKSENKKISESKTEKKSTENKKSSESKPGKKTTESKPENKKTSESKSEKKPTESKTENKKSSESKSEKKPTESKTENKKSSESKSEKKPTESKTENKKTSESKSEKKSTESKSEKKPTESKPENKKSSESKSEKKASDNKTSENKNENKKSQEGKADTGKKDIGKTNEAGNGADGTKEGTIDSGSDGKNDVAPDETAESPQNKENTDEITEETKEEVTDKDEAEKEETEKENTDKDTKKKETSDKEKDTKNSDSKSAKKESSKKESSKEANKDSDKKESTGKGSGKESSKESGKKESTDKASDKKDGDSTESGKKDNSSAESGNKGSSSNESGKKGSSSPESDKRGGTYAESGNNGGQASQPAKENASVSASGKGGAGIIDPDTGLPRDFVNGATSRSEINKTRAFGVGQDQGFEILLYDEQGVPLYGNKAGVLIYRGKVLKNSNMLKNGKILKNGKLLVDGKVFTIAAKTLPVTGGRVNLEFWLGLSILSALGAYKLFETKRKKAK